MFDRQRPQNQCFLKCRTPAQALRGIRVSGSTKIPPVELAREIVREGEARLETTLALSTAAVARATTLCGIFCAASVALGAAVLAYLDVPSHFPGLVWAGTVTTVLLFVASALSAFAGAAREFWIKGAKPDELLKWAWDGEGGIWRSEAEMLKVAGDRLTKAIEGNRQLLKREGRYVNWSLWTALGSVVLGALTYLALALV